MTDSIEYLSKMSLQNTKIIELLSKTNSSLDINNERIINSINSLKSYIDTNSLIRSNNRIGDQLAIISVAANNQPVREKLDRLVDINQKQSEQIINTNNLMTSLNKMIGIMSDKTRKSTHISYPSSGIATVNSGYITIDFYDGIITLPDNTTANMSASLKNTNEQYIRSYTIYTNKQIDISIVGKGTQSITILPGIFRVPFIEIDKIRIHTTESTDMWISGCTVENGSPEINNKEMPSTIIAGSKTDISTTSSQVTTTSTPITKVVTIKCRSLGTGTYIALGNEDSQEFRLTAVGDSYDIDFIDSLDKVYVITDVGNSGAVEFIGA